MARMSENEHDDYYVAGLIMDSLDATNDYFDGVLRAKGDEEYKLYSSALHMHIQIIGENVGKLSGDFYDMYSDLFDPVSIMKTRNFISHSYEFINPRLIEDLVRNKLPQLHDALSAFMRRYEIENG